MAKFFMWVLAIFVLIIGILAFIVASLEKKIKRIEEEKKHLNSALSEEKAEKVFFEEQSKKYKEELEKYAELQNQMQQNNLDGVDASIQLVHQLAQSGQNRNR